MLNAPTPDGLNPEDHELVPSPLATYGRPMVPRWQAETFRELVPAHTLVRRAVAALCTGATDVVKDVLAQSAVSIEDVLRAALYDAAELAIRAAKGDNELAAQYFENLLEAQRIIDAE
ncbi:hypothetical protein MM1S1540310_3142 [Mycobacteroides abscessus subsp. bolletii 1S-154-0310]|uniref:hypothetical protein n=1 Tax=Mycobacteroides abscessus TaxID=36809 RepID=UPI0002682887|nr:hypothetical protein [Mycobacteroides abscessus]EIU63244.1 hypothetical protein MM1S1510930_3585 [Mycobacteroides abscessus subsp. bolletii 1S-151-0930]EIU70529.1 hypothetical protein MM1S1520914_3791 [Mycobacteroides abscessus subsp. bolletii 1S-152-0914]EIU73824.1 hypothetical protein MM1S1530915_3135 [Mycobacteroides abscessus subsp. bolletii 1S-153-0915]EIU79858.1 hypothetical protein MM1S1540310_3142 [Mycobacteroides abscessus subsp. bolletii 1S-154-0310]MBE5481570.1 hypothetical prote